MDWLKEHWFKAGVLLALILLAASPTYYFVYYLPKQQADAQTAKDLDQSYNQMELQNCISKADSDYLSVFKQDCKLQGYSNCDTNPELSMVTIAALQKDRDNQKDFCLKEYPQN